MVSGDQVVDLYTNSACRLIDRTHSTGTEIVLGGYGNYGAA